MALLPYLDPGSPFSKDTWLPGVYEQLEDTPGLLFNMVDQIEPIRVQGRNTFVKLDIGDSLGQGMLDAISASDFPAADDAEFDEGAIIPARLAHTASLTMNEWEMLRSEVAAAVDVVASKISKATNKMTREIARQTHMDGTSILARTGVTTASNTVVLQTTDSNQYDRDRANWIAPRRVLIDIVDAVTGAAVAEDRHVTAVADDYSTITIDGAAVTTDTGDVITWAGSVDDFSSGTYVSGEFAGLGQLMKTDRVWLGIDSATAGKEYWDPVVVPGAVPGTPEAFSLGRIQRLYVEMAKRASDGMQPGPNSGHVLMSSHGVAAHAIATAAGAIRYNDPGDGSVLEFGFQELKGLGIRWMTDVHYANHVLDCLRVQGEYGIQFVRPMNPMQGVLDFVTVGSGDMWHLQTATTGNGHRSAMNSYLTALMGLCAKKPSDHGRLDDITTVTSIA